MRRIIAGIVFALGLTGTAAAADPVFGTWRTEKDDNGNFGHIRVEACGTRVCGTLIKSFDASGAEMASPNIGRKIVWDMLAKGDGAYGDGRIWSPDRDKTYKSKMHLNGDQLAVEGCVMMFCRDGGTWQRVK